MAPYISDFRDYGDSSDWAGVSGAVSADGAPVAESPAKWLPERAAQVRANGRRDGFSSRLGGGGGSIAPYDANAGQRFRISMALHTTHDWVSRSPNYRPARLLVAFVAGTGKSFAIHALKDIVRNLLGRDGDSKLFAPAGVAAFHVGGPTGHRLLRVPTGKKAFGQIEPLKGDALRAAHDSLRRFAFLVGDERGMIGRARMGWLEYRASLDPPIASSGRSSHMGVDGSRESSRGRHPSSPFPLCGVLRYIRARARCQSRSSSGKRPWRCRSLR